MRRAVAPIEGTDRASWYPSLESLLPVLDSIIQPGDFILIKGSRGSALERSIPRLQAIGEMLQESAA